MNSSKLAVNSCQLGGFRRHSELAQVEQFLKLLSLARDAIGRRSIWHHNFKLQIKHNLSLIRKVENKCISFNNLVAAHRINSSSITNHIPLKKETSKTGHFYNVWRFKTVPAVSDNQILPFLEWLWRRQDAKFFN